EESRRSQEGGHPLGIHGHGRRVSLRAPPGGLPAERGELPLEAPHARLPRVAPYEEPERRVRERDVPVEREAVLGRLLRRQVPSRDLDLLVLGVPGQLEDLHAVAERLTATRRRAGARIGSSRFAVVMNRTRERSKGTSR